MLEKLKSILIITLLIIILVLCGVVVYLWYRRRHTKERFAFYSLLAVSTLAGSVILSLAGNLSVLGIIVYALNEVFNWSIPIREATIESHLLSVTVILIIRSMVIKLHQNWESDSQTIRQVENEKRNITTSITSDFLVQFKDFIKKDPSLQLYQPNDEDRSYNLLSEIDIKHTPWHINVAELLPLVSSQYHINEEKDWYSEYNCYLSTYGKDNAHICIYCSINEPSEQDIGTVVSFVKRQRQEFDRIILAIHNGKSDHQKYIHPEIRIERKYRDEILDNLVDFSSYFSYLHKRFYDEKISVGSDKTLEDIYVPAKAKYEETLVEIDNIEDAVLDWVHKDNSNKHLAILGEYGQGKSVFALKLSLDLIAREDKRIPILLELRGKSPRNLNRLELLATWASNFRLDPTAILKLHLEGRLLLIFEGFDEMDLVGNADMRMNHFRSLWQFAKTPRAKILITGRPNFFLDDIEQKGSLGIYKPTTPDTPHCQAIYLERFTVNQIQLSLRNSGLEVRDGILGIIQNRTTENKEYQKRILDLVSRPSTLFLISSIWEKKKLGERKEQLNSAIVIKEFIQAAYERQHLKGITTPLTVEERRYFMLGIAMGIMWNDGYTNQISKEELNRSILKVLENFPENGIKSKSAFEDHIIPLKGRLDEDEDIAKDSIFVDVRSCGIIVKDLARINHFKFAHKSFMELLVSEYYISSLFDTEEEKEDLVYPISKSFGDKRLIKESKETIGFIAQLIQNKFSKEYQSAEGRGRISYKLLSAIGRSSVRSLKLVSSLKYWGILTPGSVIFAMSTLLIFTIVIMGKSRREGDLKLTTSLRIERFAVNSELDQLNDQRFVEFIDDLRPDTNNLQRYNDLLIDLGLDEHSHLRENAILSLDSINIELDQYDNWHAENDTAFWNRMYFFISLCFLFAVPYLSLLGRKYANLSQEIRLWYLICKELEIEEETLHTFINKKYLDNVRKDIDKDP